MLSEVVVPFVGLVVVAVSVIAPALVHAGIPPKFEDPLLLKVFQSTLLKKPSFAASLCAIEITGLSGSVLSISTGAVEVTP